MNLKSGEIRTQGQTIGTFILVIAVLFFAGKEIVSALEAQDEVEQSKPKGRVGFTQE